MIQPANLPAAGNLLLALGLPGDGASELTVSGDFSSLLAARLEAAPVAAIPPGLTIQPAIAPATGKQTGKPDGKGLPQTLAAAVSVLPLVEDGVLVDPTEEAEISPRTPAEIPASDVTLSPASSALPQILAAFSPPQKNLAAATPHKPAVTAGAAPAALSAFRLAAKAAVRRVVPQLPSPAQAQLRAIALSPAVVSGAISIPEILPAAKFPSPHGGTSLAPVAELMPLPQPSSLPGIAAILPASSPPVKAALLIRAAPLVVDPPSGAPVISATGKAVSIPHILPGLALPFGLQSLAVPPQLATADAPQLADDTPVEAPAFRPTDAAISPAAGEIPSMATPLAVPQTPAQPSLNAPLIAAQPSAPTQQPHDFAALIDRLVEAREAARASSVPGTVHAAVAHADFGQISLQFQQDGGGLSVALASGDPEFTRAVQAAATAGQTSPGSDNSAQQRHEAPGQQSQGQQSQGLPPRGQSSARDTGQARPSANPGQAQRGGDQPPARSGIFA